MSVSGAQFSGSGRSSNRYGFLPLFNDNSGMRTKAGQNSAKRIEFERDTSGSRSKALPRCMDEYRAAASGHARPRIVINLDNEVIKIVLARQSISACVRGDFDRPVVVAISGIFAPAIRHGYALYW